MACVLELSSPCPHDAAGFERHEAADNARFLIERGVPPSHILEESVSLETVGNGLVYGGLAWVPEGGPRRRRFRARRPPIRRGVWGVYSSFSIVLGGISRSHGVLGSMPCRAAMHAPWPWWGQGCVVSTRVGC